MTLPVDAISVVIATIGRGPLVVDCLRSMAAVGTPPSVEVVVIDAGGDGWVDEAAVKAVWPNTRVFKSAIRNASVQRNRGVKLARGEVVIFLDDDCYVQSGWWPAIVSPLCGDRSQKSEVRSQNEEAVGGQRSEGGGRVACVAGAVWRNPHPTFTDARGGYVNGFGFPIQVTHRSEKAPREVDWPISCNMACLKSAYVEVGGMAEVYGVYDEDVDLGLKWRKAGWRIVFEPQAAVYHYSVSQQRRVTTKKTEFRAGRNRAVLLVRNYGVSSRLVLFLSVTPFVKAWEVLSVVSRQLAKSAGHAAAYLGGVVWGLLVGTRNPVKKDRERFDGQG